MDNIKHCPLCSGQMESDGVYLRCMKNKLHVCLIEEEWEKHIAGEKDINWLRWRMKVRLGKMVNRR